VFELDHRARKNLSLPTPVSTSFRFARTSAFVVCPGTTKFVFIFCFISWFEEVCVWVDIGTTPAQLERSKHAAVPATQTATRMERATTMAKLLWKQRPHFCIAKDLDAGVSAADFLLYRN
jgi:hypothetical protein